MQTETRIGDGVWPVMLTPFDHSGGIDWPAFDALIEYYVDEKVAGIFSVCTSSEFLNLSMEETVELSRRSVDVAAGRIGVIATGNFGCTLKEQIDNIRRVADTGVDAPVIATSFLPSSENLLDQILEIADKTDIPLGIYESPIPEHRTLTVGEVYEVALTGRFLALKETSRDLPTFLEKVRRARGTNLRLFQANLRIFLDSGIFHGAGFMGCLANTFPRLIRDYIESIQDPAFDAEGLKKFMLAVEKHLYKNSYPASSKYILSRLGVPMEPMCRSQMGAHFSSSQQVDLELFLNRLQFCFVDTARGQSLTAPTNGYADLIEDLTTEMVAPPID